MTDAKLAILQIGAAVLQIGLAIYVSHPVASGVLFIFGGFHIGLFIASLTISKTMPERRT